jgi:hypothetical protein
VILLECSDPQPLCSPRARHKPRKRVGSQRPREVRSVLSEVWHAESRYRPGVLRLQVTASGAQVQGHDADDEPAGSGAWRPRRAAGRSRGCRTDASSSADGSIGSQTSRGLVHSEQAQRHDGGRRAADVRGRSAVARGRSACRRIRRTSWCRTFAFRCTASRSSRSPSACGTASASCSGIRAAARGACLWSAVACATPACCLFSARCPAGGQPARRYDGCRREHVRCVRRGPSAAKGRFAPRCPGPVPLRTTARRSPSPRPASGC